MSTNIELLSPIRIPTPPGTVAITIDYTYVSHDGDFSYTKDAFAIQFSEKLLGLGEANMVGLKIDTNALSLDNIGKYYQFQSMINHCVNNGEAIHHRLRNLLLFKIKPKDKFKTDQEIRSMDFMSLRNVFSQFLQHYKPLHEETRYNEKYKIKNITRTFNEYILNRNIYTHGILKVRLPSNDFIIHSRRSNNGDIYSDDIYSIVNLEILMSFMNVSNDLREVLTEVGALYKI